MSGDDAFGIAPLAFERALQAVLRSLLDRHRAVACLRDAMPPDDRDYLDLVERRLLGAEDALVCWLRRYDEEIILQRYAGPDPKSPGHGL
jgi:hypothetical protein